jgi:predicted PurR-regulated permease PerM
MAKIEGRWIALLAVTGVVIYLNWLMLVPFLGVIAWASVLVIVFWPVHRRIVARTKSPALSALLSCLLVVFVILIPVTLVTLAVVNEASKLGDNVQAIQANGFDLLDPNSPLTGRLVRFLEPYIDLGQLRASNAIAERLRGMTGAIASRTLSFVGGVVGAIVQIFFIVFTMYYLFRDGDRILDKMKDLLPLSRVQSQKIFDRTRDVIFACVYGVVVIAAIQGTLGGVAFWALGLSAPLLWGTVMALCSMIPMLGSFIVWVPAAIYLAFTGNYVKAAMLAAWGALVIGMIDNFLRPKLVGERTRLHELLIFFSVLGGLQAFGILGIVLGPVIVAILLALIDVYRHATEPSQAEGEPDAVERQEEVRNV